MRRSKVTVDEARVLVSRVRSPLGRVGGLSAVLVSLGSLACGGSGDTSTANDALASPTAPAAPGDGMGLAPGASGAAAVPLDPVTGEPVAMPVGTAEPTPGAMNDPNTGLPSASGTGTAPLGPIAGAAVDGTCVPLCLTGALTDPPVVDGFGFESGASCIVPEGPASVGRSPCEVGGVIVPQGPPVGAPGVALDGTCFALCTSAQLVDDGTGFGFEFDAPCVFPESAVVPQGVACTIGNDITGASFDGQPGRYLGGGCVRFCEAPPAGDVDGFSFEQGASCVIDGSLPATTRGFDCVVGEDVLSVPLSVNPNPPPGEVVKPAGVASSGFFVAGGRLYDKFGNDFVIRGINSPHIWFDTGDQYLAYNALDDMRDLGANTIRMVWLTAGTPELMRLVLRRIVELQMVPMIELHDFTGDGSNASLLEAAAYYTRADILSVLQEFEDFLLINVANEWSGTDFMGGYQSAIGQLRAGGVNHTLVIDANGFGQNAASLLTNGGALLNADPQGNLLFSVHMYQSFSSPANITQTLQSAVTMGLPLIVGEFGFQAGTPLVPIDAALILSECARLGLGYIPWSWKGNGADVAFLDMAVDWEGQQLTAWGEMVLNGTNGVAQSAMTASIFSL